MNTTTNALKKVVLSLSGNDAAHQYHIAEENKQEALTRTFLHPPAAERAFPVVFRPPAYQEFIAIAAAPKSAFRRRAR